MRRFIITEVYSRTVDNVTPLRVGGLRINRWEIELTVDAIKHDKKHYLLKLSPNQNAVKYLFLLFLSLGEVAMNLRKPPWWRFLHIYVLYVTKAQCTYCRGNDTMSCNYTAVRHNTVTQGEQSENNRYTPRDYKGDREGIPHIHPILR